MSHADGNRPQLRSANASPSGSVASDSQADAVISPSVAPLTAAGLRDESGHAPNQLVLEWQLAKAVRDGSVALFVQLCGGAGTPIRLEAYDTKGTRHSLPIEAGADLSDSVSSALGALQRRLAQDIIVFPHGSVTTAFRSTRLPDDVESGLLSYFPALDAEPRGRGPNATDASASVRRVTHLDRLEAESVHILREAVAEGGKPVMLYSIGKDSSVMLHLARKAFFPGKVPFPLLHVDTRWKFREMYLFRDHMARTLGVDLLVHINPDAIRDNINPFDHGSSVHTDVTKTQALRQVLDAHRFDVVLGGARRDEEKSRAKERIFSLRSAGHGWDPKNQRPEMWNLFNVSVRQDESLRVFPLSNWTELDVWEYIYRENIPVVPLYFAKERPVVVRGDLILMVDDERMRLEPGEHIESRTVRFRTLGCYPLSGAIESQATTVAEIILELMGAQHSERQGRRIDADAPGSMERKKREGYF